MDDEVDAVGVCIQQDYQKLCAAETRTNIDVTQCRQNGALQKKHGLFLFINGVSFRITSVKSNHN